MEERPVLPVNSDTELLGQIEELNRNEKQIPDTCAHLLIAEHATVRPEAVAVSSLTGNLTYRHLNTRADAVAAWLSAQAVSEEDLIGVLGERNPDFLIAILGIWKAGAAYLALDPAWPSLRTIDVLRQADCSVVLTTSASGEAWDPADDATTTLASISDISKGARTRSCQAGSDPKRLAYVIFTSGSTGRPKGAMVEHLGMLNHLFAKVNDLELTASDRVVQNASQAFDISVWQFIAPLVVGGSVRIVGNDVAHDPGLLLREMDSAETTVLEVVPSMLHMMVEHLESSAERPALSGLRWLLATGETLPPDLCRRWLALYPGIPLLNAYGPTECSDDVTHHPIYTPLDSGSRLVPIGRPVANMRTYVMKRERGAYSLCAPGSKGELFVAGRGVGRGYLNDPEATRKAFFRDPFRPEREARIYRTGDRVRMRTDGVLEFFGRMDRQLKIRGHRIQPEEIEAVLREHPGVKDAVVSLWQNSDGLQDPGSQQCGSESQLVAFVQPRWRNSATVAGYPRHELPNGMAIARLTRSEADFLYADIFERNAYTKHGLSIHPGACVVDVGANIGLFSLFAHEQSQGGAIYAFEPVPELFQLLRVNLRLYDVNAQLYQYGLARSPGTTTITYYPGFSTLSGLYPDLTQDKDVALSYVRHRREREPALASESTVEDELIEGLLEDRFQAQTQSIALTTLSDFIAENEIGHIDFLKVNVEGAELDVLHGIQPAHWPRIAQIALELHDVDGRLRDVQDILNRQGFDVAVEQDWSLEQTMKTNFYLYARRPHAAQAARSRAQSRHTRTGNQQARILSDADLRGFLRDRLPDYMAPSEYRFMERFPLTPTGKVDCRRLTTQTGTAMSRVDPSTPARPRTEVERALVGIWEEVLGRDRIGIHDNFFDRGGHSLLGARVLARVRTTIGPELPLRSIFEHPTVARLARAIEEAKAATV